MSGQPLIRVIHGDLQTHPCDALALLVAGRPYGPTAKVVDLLKARGLLPTTPMLGPGQVVRVDTRSAIGASVVLFVGGPPLEKMSYEALGSFGAAAAEASSDQETLALIAHGPGFGLDGLESAKAIALGALEGLRRRPSALESVTMIEGSPGKAAAIAREFDLLFGAAEPSPEGRAYVEESAPTWRLAEAQAQDTQEPAGRAGDQKPHAFVAMPFSDDFEDVFNFGIQMPVRAAGLVCERLDRAAFIGDIVQRIRERIAGAQFVIADLTEANPNVFLEVGLAWGLGKPTVLLTKHAQEDLPFDVRSQRMLQYKNSTGLQTMLEAELKALREAGAI